MGGQDSGDLRVLEHRGNDLMEAPTKCFRLYGSSVLWTPSGSIEISGAFRLLFSPRPVGLSYKVAAEGQDDQDGIEEAEEWVHGEARLPEGRQLVVCLLI